MGGVTVAAPPSQAAQVISTTPSSHLQSSPHLALPLAIALPGRSASGELPLFRNNRLSSYESEVIKYTK